MHALSIFIGGTGDSTFRDLKEVLDRSQKPSKELNKIIIKPVDVGNVIKGDL